MKTKETIRPHVFIGADHRGFALKNKIVQRLRADGYGVTDVGTDSDREPCDYPRIAREVAEAVAGARRARGILVCMTGIGHCIAANKVPGVYAALCYNKQAAVLSRQHNNANVLVLGARFVSVGTVSSIIRAWLSVDFEGGRHLRRFRQIQRIEKKWMKPRGVFDHRE